MIWFPIATAPKDKYIDIWAKCWMPHNDSFMEKRFPDCKWDNSIDNRPTKWKGLDNGWFPTHWAEIPTGPEK